MHRAEGAYGVADADAPGDGLGDAIAATALLGRLAVGLAKATNSARPAIVSMRSVMHSEVPYG